LRQLSDEEAAMRSGAFGSAVRWAIEHQIKVGDYLGAEDFVSVTQAHIMADTESLGVAGVEWLERMAALPGVERRVRIPTISDPRGTDFAAAHRLKQHQLPDHHAAGIRRTPSLWRHWRGDLRQQRVRHKLAGESYVGRVLVLHLAKDGVATA
jgi:predicted aconitase